MPELTVKMSDGWKHDETLTQIHLVFFYVYNLICKLSAPDERETMDRDVTLLQYSL